MNPHVGCLSGMTPAPKRYTDFGEMHCSVLLRITQLSATWTVLGHEPDGLSVLLCVLFIVIFG